MSKAHSLAASLVLLCTSLCAGAQPTLLKEDRALLAVAVASGKTEVSVMILGHKGSNQKIVSAIEAMGGSVRFREDAIDYVRVFVPVGKIEAIAAWPDVFMLNLISPTSFRLSSRDKMEVPAVPTGQLPWKTSVMEEAMVPGSGRVPAPTKENLEAGGYLPLARHGVPQLLKKNPTYDGRGVVVAIVDGPIDPLIEELQWAKDLKGRDIPKIVDVFAVADKARGNVGLATTIDTVMQTGGSTIEGRQYRMPTDAELHIGMLDPKQIEKGSVLANGNSNPWAVAWDEKTDLVWVDTNRNFDFTDERTLHLTSDRHDWVVLGADDPKTPVRESLAFSLELDKDAHRIGFRPLLGGHGGMLAATIAARNYMGGSYHGMAPNAQLLGIEAGGNSSYIDTPYDALVAAMRDPRVDVVSSSTPHAMPIGDILADRLIETYRKPIVEGAGNNNGAVAGNGSNPAYGRHVLAIGAYMPRELLWANFGVRVSEDEYIADYSGLGPGPDGGLKPDFLALTGTFVSEGAVSSCCDVYPSPWQQSPRYTVGGGTSQAQPSAAGAVAVLISAAKQAGVKYDPWRLRQALRHGALPIARYSAHSQGYGVIRVDRAWDALRKMKSEPVDVTLSAPLACLSNAQDRIPAQGRGLYEREGWSAGDRSVRKMTFTRNNGARETTRYQVHWRQNDGTFSSADLIELALGAATPFEVTIAPEVSGAHSAILELVDPKSQEAVFSTMATVIAAEDFKLEQNFIVRHEASAERPGHKSFFLRVPEGVETLSLEFEILQGGAWFAARWANGATPTLFPVREMGPGSFFAMPKYLGPGRTRYFIQKPVAGVWEVLVKADGDDYALDPLNPKPVKPTQFLMEAAIHAVDLKPLADAEGVVATNKFAPIQGRIVARPSTRSERKFALTNSERQKIIDINVPKGTGQLVVNAKILNGAGDVDVYLFDMSGREPALKVKANARGDEMVVFDRPKAGHWRVLLDLASDEQAVEIAYEDELVIQHNNLEFFSVAQASVDVADRIKPHGTGDSWATRMLENTSDFAWVPKGRTPAIQWIAIDPAIGSDIDPNVLGAVTVPLLHADRNKTP